jgi:hypothetical protein
MEMERGTDEAGIWECLGPVDPDLGCRGVPKITFHDDGAITVERPGCGWWEPQVDEDYGEHRCPNCGEPMAVRWPLSARDAVRALAVARGVPPSIAMSMMDVGPELPDEEDPP